MTFRRREVLATLGLASAQALLWTFGCGAQPPPVRLAPQVSRDVRSWLHDAVARLSAIYPTVHALAVSRRRTTAALDVLGPGFGRLRRDGAVLTVRSRDGRCREQVTSELTAAGIAAAADALGATAARAKISFGPPPATPDEPPPLDEHDLRRRLDQLQTDAHPSSRIVYAAALLDIDDAIVWSVAPGRDLEQRLVRIRQSVTRAAWNGSRPSVAEAERAWSGWLDDQSLSPADLAATDEAALKLMTPGGFDDGERIVILDPSVAALALDAAARHLLTATASPAAAPPALARLVAGAPLASPAVTLVDDPTAAGAYGRFAFDDEGEPAAPLTLLEAGRFANRLADHATGGAGRGRRPGHLGRVEPAPSHLQLAPGLADTADLYTDGLVLEAGRTASYDPASDRTRITCSRARQLAAGHTTGRIYADVELVGSLTSLLTAVDAVAREPAAFAVARTDEPRWQSIATPAVRTRGLVRIRRSRA